MLSFLFDLTNRVKRISIVSVCSQVSVYEVKIHPVSIFPTVRLPLIPDKRSNSLSALRPNPGTFIFQLNSPSPPTLPSYLRRKYIELVIGENSFVFLPLLQTSRALPSWNPSVQTSKSLWGELWPVLFLFYRSRWHHSSSCQFEDWREDNPALRKRRLSSQGGSQHPQRRRGQRIGRREPGYRGAFSSLANTNSKHATEDPSSYQQKWRFTI